MPLPLKACAVLAALATTGCGGDDGPDLPPSATIGAGGQSFESLNAGDTASVILGPQGGFHIIGSVRVTGIKTGDPDNLGAADNPTTRFEVTRAGVRVDSMGAEYTQGLDAVGEGNFEMVGRIVILDILSDDELEGDTIEFKVTVTDVDGVSVTDSVSLVAMPDPRNP